MNNHPALGYGLLLLFIFCNLHAIEPAPLTHSLTKMQSPLPMPALILPDMDQEVVDIQGLKGKVIIVNFWATWCPPCRREMSSLEKLHLAMKDKPVVILAVNIGEEVETVFPFINTIEPSPSFPILFDTHASSMETWGVKGLPTTYIINADGQVVYQAIGGREFDHPEFMRKIIDLTP